MLSENLDDDDIDDDDDETDESDEEGDDIWSEIFRMLQEESEEDPEE